MDMRWMTLVLCNSVLQYLLFAKACRGICSTFDHTTPHTVCDYERSKAVRAAPAKSCNYGYVVELAAGEGEQVIGRSRAFMAQVTTPVCVHLNTIDAVFTEERGGGRKNSWPGRPQSLCQDPTLLFAPINSSRATTKRIAVLLSLLTC